MDKGKKRKKNLLQMASDTATDGVAIAVAETRVLQGLKAAAMNGKLVVVMVALDASTGRVKVKLPSGKVVAVKAENLRRPVSDAELETEELGAPVSEVELAAAAVSKTLPVGNRDLSLDDFLALMRAMQRGFERMHPEFEVLCRGEGVEGAQEWIETQAMRIQAEVYAEFGVDQKGFAFYQRKHDSPALRQAVLAIVAVRKKIENLRVALLVPEWLMELQVEQMMMKREALHAWPRDYSNFDAMARLIERYQTNFLRMLGATVEAVRKESGFGSADEVLSNEATQMKCLEMFLPNWNALKKAIIADVDMMCDQRDMEIAFAQYVPKKWEKMQMLVHQQLNVRFAAAMQRISNLLEGKA